MAQVATPTADKSGAKYYGSQLVTISCATPSADIYYTTDGTTPDTESYYYVEPIIVPRTLTLKAIAMKDEFDDSEIMTEDYSIWLKANDNIIGLVTSQNIQGTVSENYIQGKITYEKE